MAAWSSSLKTEELPQACCEVCSACSQRGELTAILWVTPSDHYVEREAPLLEAALEAIAEARSPRERLVLLGMEPEEDDPEYGWIVPGPKRSHGIREVASFLEKSDRATARKLMLQAALINSLIFLVMGVTLLDLYDAALPALLRRFLVWAHLEGGALAFRVEAEAGDDALARHPYPASLQAGTGSARPCSSSRNLSTSSDG